MPIIRNLRKDFDEGRMDNLRSLRYEDSGIKAPYITKPEGSSSNQISKRVDDLSRIGQMLIDKPGVKHLANEALLKQGEITKQLEGNNGTLVGNIIRRAGGTVKHVAQVIGSTLAQVPVNGTGTHFLRAFRTDTYLQENDATSGFGQFFGAGGVEGTQYALRGERVPSEALINGSKLPLRNTTANKGDLGQTNVGIEGDIAVDNDPAKYNSDLTYTGTSTNENVANVVGGAHVNKSERLEANTTASPGDLGTDIQAANDSGNLRAEIKTINDYSSLASYTGTDITANVNNVTNGQSIPKPDDLSRNTTPSKGSLGVDKKDIEGTIPENVNVAQGNYRSDTTYNEKSTEDNIINANTGAPINNPSGTGEFNQTFAVQTTALEGTFGVTNKAIEGDITELSPKTENTFTEASTYTGFDTKGNINSIQSRETFGTGGSIPLRGNLNFDTIKGSSKSIEEIKQSTDLYDGTNSSLGSGKQIQDFRSEESINNFNGGVRNSYSFDYNNRSINKETRVGLGDQGRYRKENSTSYVSGTYTKADKQNLADKLNLLDVSRNPLDGTKADGISGNRDLIQLEFQIMTPDQGNYYLGFRAFLDTFDDSFNASWNTHKYLGRADNFYTYSGFERSITIGFKIAAASAIEMRPLYRKAATLASVTAPTYGDNGRFMRGSIAKVTVGDYIYEQPGIIESVQYNWQKDYPWEISFNNPENGDLPKEQRERAQVLPHVLDVSVSFKVIHDFLPQTGITPFITNYKRDDENKENYIKLVDNSKAQIGTTPAQPAATLPPPVDASLEGAPSNTSFGGF